ncbi:protein FAM3C [Paralichthys olivaceus]|uniref:protein FAM3C n=1 Tax=Paralichthys olivaceus TaxID=8255 RepID=UPI00097CF659|nr:PREDICTED: protein FAM3C-like [Paralichthys olivaceus]
MKYQVVLYPVAGIVFLLLIWGIASFDVQDKSTKYFGLYEKDRVKLKTVEELATARSKCGVSKLCGPGHYAFHIRSGAANTVGPKICFEGKMIMSEVHNNVGIGLNVVVVNGKTGDVENIRLLNGSPQEVLAFLNDIKPGMILLAATYDNANGMSKEIREFFTALGSSKVKSLNTRDNWVFAARTGTPKTVHFEQLNVNEETKNLYEGWPETAETEGCFSSSVGQQNLPEV